MRNSAKIVLTGLSLLCLAAATPKNWDRVDWRMDINQLERTFPALTYKDGDWFAWLPEREIARSATLAKLIQPGTKVRFRFDFNDAWRVSEVSFIVPLDFNKAEAALEARFGLPVSGDRTEARCFDAKGNRLIEDPSGVGHIIASCVAHATFVDLKHGNYYEITTEYKWQMEHFGSKLEFGKAQTVSIGPIANCSECSAKP